MIIQLVITEVRKRKMSKSFRDTKGKADEEDAAASDLQETEVLRDTATVSMMEEIGNYSLPSSAVTSSSNINASVLHLLNRNALKGIPLKLITCLIT